MVTENILKLFEIKIFCNIYLCLVVPLVTLVLPTELLRTFRKYFSSQKIFQLSVLTLAKISVSMPRSGSSTVIGEKLPSLTKSVYSRIPPAATQGTSDWERGWEWDSLTSPALSSVTSGE